MADYKQLLPGDPAPWFHQRSLGNPNYAFDTAAGRYIVLCFFISASDAAGQAAIAAARALPEFFNDETAAFFGVSADPSDEQQGRFKESYPGYRFLLDFDGTASRLYGAMPQTPPADGRVQARRFWMVLDPTMRIMKVFPFTESGGEHAEIAAYLKALPPPRAFTGQELMAPIIVLPNVFEPEFCAQLISLYHADGGEESGFMREVNGRTVPVHDHSHKRRRDYNISDQAIIQACQSRFMRRIVPEILKVHQYKVTRMERYLVACYAAADEAHFRAHRDNTTKGTAHRRFAVSVNLNDDFDGGEVSFPEYGPRSFKAPAGGAVVFSCSMLHAVSKVTRGNRFAFLPFLYDDEAARIREANNQFLGEGVGNYASGEKTPA